MQDQLIRQLLTVTSSVPVLWIIVLLLLAEWRLSRRGGWNLLLCGWLCNTGLFYVESVFRGVLDEHISELLSIILSAITSVLFLAFALRHSRNYRQTVTVSMLRVGAVLAAPFIVASIFTGNWHASLAVFATFTMIASAAALRDQLRESSQHIRHLLVLSWFTCGGLYLAYFLKFRIAAGYIAIVFAVAWLTKLGIAGGLFLLFKEDVGVFHARRVALESQARQQVAFSWFAHEMKNPLHALGFRVATLSKRLELHEYAKAGDDATKMAEAVMLLNGIVNSALLAAGPVSPTDVTYFSVNDAIAAAVRQVRALFAIDAATVRTQFAYGVRVCGSFTAVTSVFTNLLRNALEACADLTPAQLEQTRHQKVAIVTSHAMDEVFITVTDYGAGIAHDVLERIFDPYYSTKLGINRGLGLWIARSSIEALHGTISVTSPIPDLGRGSVFAIVLPLATHDDVAPAAFLEHGRA